MLVVFETSLDMLKENIHEIKKIAERLSADKVDTSPEIRKVVDACDVREIIDICNASIERIENDLVEETIEVND
jgi:hypothetical protein